MTADGERERAGARSWLALAGFLALSFAASAIGGVSTRTGPGSWYSGIEKPAFNPPGWVFGPVWTVLYVLIGVSAWLVWRRRGVAGARGPLLLWLVQLALNAAWPALFFASRRPDLASLEIAALWLAILATMVAFRRVRPLAAWLLAPYLAWVTFASVLTFTIWRLNG
ncbi:MAG TPA: TspO/MBR family protein [Longimicrobium sp.]|nr:TspO/MBR family protein [Longimicrobium sp.]